MKIIFEPGDKAVLARDVTCKCDWCGGMTATQGAKAIVTFAFGQDRLGVDIPLLGRHGNGWIISSDDLKPAKEVSPNDD